MICIIKYINAYFFDLILDGLKNDICLQHLVENGVTDQQNTQMFLMSYLFERFDKFINKGITTQLLTKARPYSKSILIGHTDINFNNYCLYTFVDHEGMLYLDVGISYFLIQFWKRIFEYQSLFNRYLNIIDETSEKKMRKRGKFQENFNSIEQKLQNYQNTQTLDCNALSISTLNNTTKLNKSILNQKNQLDQLNTNQVKLVHKKLQTEPQLSLESVIQEQKQSLKMLLSMQDQNAEKIQLQQRQIDYLLNENANLRQQISGNNLYPNQQQQQLKVSQLFDNTECSETPSPIGIQYLGKDINLQQMRDMLKCSHTYD